MARKRKKQQTPKVPVPSMRKGLKGFFEDVGKEMGRVVWPSREDTVRLTILVLIICVVFVLYLWAFGMVVQVGINGLMGRGLGL